LFDATLTHEEIAEDYMSCAFGEDWREFYAYLKELGEAFDFAYMEGSSQLASSRSQWYKPEHEKSLARVKDIIENARPLVERNYNSEYRVRTVSVRLIEKHMIYAAHFAEAMRAKALGNDDEADRLYKNMRITAGKFEAEIERCYDHGLAFRSLKRIFDSRTPDTEPIIF
jgi:hypothetical protein